MENTQILDDAGSSKHLEFKGEGGSYFGIWIVNALLTFFTLGIYYAWARNKERHFFISNTYLANSPFAYHGTGKELFKGFLKVIALMVVPYIVLFAAISSRSEALIMVAYLVFMGGILAIFTFAIHGALRYRTSRTSWKGIFFGYTGDRMELVKLFFKNILLTIVTFGIYGSWANVNIRTYIFDHLNFGDVKFKFKGTGKDLFITTFVGLFLTVITFGIYIFWYLKNIINFYIENTTLEQNGTEIELKSTLTGGGIFGLTFVNMLLVMVTFGIALPWVVIRNINYYLKNIEIGSNLKPDAITQGTVVNYGDATGDDFLDIFL